MCSHTRASTPGLAATDVLHELQVRSSYSLRHFFTLQLCVTYVTSCVTSAMEVETTTPPVAWDHLPDGPCEVRGSNEMRCFGSTAALHRK